MRYPVVILLGILLWPVASAPVLVEASRSAMPAKHSPVMAQDDDPAGSMIDIGNGRELYLECAGTGAPTVILEAADGADSSTWEPVWSDLTKQTRVCRYDRAGLGLSGPAPAAAPIGQGSVDDLHALLIAADLSGPIVLVGHSLGGLIVRLYATQYPADVAGLVLIDATPPAIVMAGLDQLPEADREAVMTLLNTLDHPTGIVPAVVLAAGHHGPPDAPPDPDFEAAWQGLQREQADVLQASFVSLPDADHVIHRDEPAVVVESIRNVLEAVRHPNTWAMTATGTPPPKQ